jgi:hypothetical protein
MKQAKQIPVVANPTFTAMHPGTIVEYRTHDQDGLRYGKFRKYESFYQRVFVETIAAFGREPVVLKLNESLVAPFLIKPTDAPKVAKLTLTSDDAPSSAPSRSRSTSAKTAPVEGWRSEAAKKAWDTIRANRAAKAQKVA